MRMNNISSVLLNNILALLCSDFSLSVVSRSSQHLEGAALLKFQLWEDRWLKLAQHPSCHCAQGAHAQLSWFFQHLEPKAILSQERCLATSNLPWFVDLTTFQVPRQCCSLQHLILLVSPVTSTTGCCLFFGSISSFFLELFLHWFPVAYWTPTNLGSSFSSVLCFCHFHTVHGVLKTRILSGLPFPSPVDHI